MDFLTFVVIVLGIIAIAQLVRTFELTSELKGKREFEPGRRENKMNSSFMLIFVIGFFIYAGWLLFTFKDALLPPPASVHGEKTDALMNFNLLVIGIVFVVTHIFLFFFAFKYVSDKNRKADYFTHSNKLELIWTVIPALFLAVIIVYGLTTWNEITDEAPEDSLLIELYGKQFDWTARYAGDDKELGAANYKLIEGVNALGIDSADQAAWDDIIVKGEFHIPVNQSVKFVFRSQDVIHSAYMPHFRQQMNTVPGMTTTFNFIPTITTKEMKEQTGDEEFEYWLLCNKICGASHFNMKMMIVVDTEEEYQQWLSEQKSFLPDGKVKSAEVEVPAEESGEKESKEENIKEV